MASSRAIDERVRGFIRRMKDLSGRTEATAATDAYAIAPLVSLGHDPWDQRNEVIELAEN